MPRIPKKLKIKKPTSTNGRPNRVKLKPVSGPRYNRNTVAVIVNKKHENVEGDWAAADWAGGDWDFSDWLTGEGG